MTIQVGKVHPSSRATPPDEIYLAGVETLLLRVENLAADGDITARAFYQAKFPRDVLECDIIPEAASAGVDGSNTSVVTLRNITQSLDIATVTRTTNWVANTPIPLAVTVANATVAANDVLGIVVTNGSTADLPQFQLQTTLGIDQV